MNYLGRKNDLLLRNGLNLRHLLAKSPSSYEKLRGLFAVGRTVLDS